MNAPATAKAVSLAAVFLTGLWVWMIWRWNEAETQAEQDQRQALRDPRRAEVQAKMSEKLWKRAERKALGVLRLGEAKRKREAA